MADAWIKFCGCATWSDVELAIETGADAFGMIFAPSPRRISLHAAAEIAARLPRSIEPVAVFVNPAESLVNEVTALLPHALLQFSGEESPEFVARYGERAIKVVHVDEREARVAERATRFPDATLLLDSGYGGLAGGTGRSFAWERAVPIAKRRRVVIAGGLTPENVGECIERVHPFGVDVRTGIESDGQKDRAKMRAFVRAVRER